MSTEYPPFTLKVLPSAPERLQKPGPPRKQVETLRGLAATDVRTDDKKTHAVCRYWTLDTAERTGKMCCYENGIDPLISKFWKFSCDWRSISTW